MPYQGGRGIARTGGTHASRLHSSHGGAPPDRLIERTNEIIVLVDSSKFDGPSGHVVCPLDEIDTVVTDADIPAQYTNEDVGEGRRAITSSFELVGDPLCFHEKISFGAGDRCSRYHLERFHERIALRRGADHRLDLPKLLVAFAFTRDRASSR